MNNVDKTFLMLKYNLDYDECTCGLDVKSLPYEFFEQFTDYSKREHATIDKIIFSSVEGRKRFLSKLVEFNGR